jgi:hypothetical protein
VVGRARHANRSVSIYPGAIELTVIPWGPSVRDNDLAEPTTAGRNAFMWTYGPSADSLALNTAPHFAKDLVQQRP